MSHRKHDIRLLKASFAYLRAKILLTKKLGLQKEGILNCIKCLYLSYTVIDTGWWYPLSLPPLPSGRIQSKAEYCTTQIVGDGNTPWELTANREIGKYVAKIIADPRTLSKSVFGYSAVHTQNAVWDILERVSGESVPRDSASLPFCFCSTKLESNGILSIRVE